MKTLLYPAAGLNAEPITRLLSHSRIQVDTAGSLDHCCYLSTTERYAAIVVTYAGSITLLKAICAQIKAQKSDCLLIVVTTNQSAFERAQLLELGVDRYYIQPFYHSQLVTEICLHEYRSARVERPTVKTSSFTIDVLARTAQFKESVLDLTRTEFDLLTVLVQKRGSVLSRLHIWETVWGYSEYPLANTIDVHMNRLRRKLPREASRLIKTVYGVGYRLHADA